MNRITIEQIEGEIAAEYSFTADKALGEGVPVHETLRLLTICILVLRNGIKVVGTSACVDPAIFDAEIGRKLAREDAVRQVWPLLGYELATKLMHREMALRRTPRFVGSLAQGAAEPDSPRSTYLEAAQQDVRALGGTFPPTTAQPEEQSP